MNRPIQTQADINPENAQQLLIEESMSRPVLAVFWTASDPDSSQLRSTLENIAEQYKGEFLLCKLDIEQNAMIAQQLGVRSLPTTMLIKEGQPVDGFAGLQEETAIREFLQGHLPPAWEKAVSEAQHLILEEQFTEALKLLRPVYDESDKHPVVAKLFAQSLIASKRIDEADEVLAAIPMSEHDALYQQLLSELELKRAAGKTPELENLEKQLAGQPDDLALKMQVAIQYHHEEMSEQALELLIQILRKDRDYDNGNARKTMLDIFKAIGNQDPLVAKYQRQLFSLLY